MVRAVGTGSKIDRSSVLASLSNTMSSPRRGRMVNPPPPNILSTVSLPSPAAFTTHRQRSGPRVVASSHVPSPAAATPVTWVDSESLTPAATASVAKASGVVQGQMMLSSGISSPPSAPGPSAGSRA